MELLFIILLAIILDLLWGEPPSSVHPVVLMGKIIQFLKPHLSTHQNKSSGIILTFILLALFAIPAYFILQLAQFNVFFYILLSGIILFTTFAIKGLLNSAYLVKNDLDTDLLKARQSVSYLVSRDTSNLSQDELVSATIESLTENITDSVVSPLFYTFIFGVLGGLVYRVINTLDAMVGYKNPENINIGWFPARMDDLANYLPARITGLLIVVSAAFMGLNWRKAYGTMIKDARNTPSPNSGYPMAATAGALEIQLEKKGYYTLGESHNSLNTEMIEQAILLSQVTIIFFMVGSFVVFALFATLITYQM